eukprot:jgi/Botrbrau1/15804/Bobra.4_1s0154.1
MPNQETSEGVRSAGYGGAPKWCVGVKGCRARGFLRRWMLVLVGGLGNLSVMKIVCGRPLLNVVFVEGL